MVDGWVVLRYCGKQRFAQSRFRESGRSARTRREGHTVMNTVDEALRSLAGGGANIIESVPCRLVTQAPAAMGLLLRASGAGTLRNLAEKRKSVRSS